MSLLVPARYKTIITYRTDFRGLPVPSNFKMGMKATKATTPPSHVVAAGHVDDLESSYNRSHSPNARFFDASGTELGQGIDGYHAMLGASVLDGDGDGGLEESVAVVVGSHTTTPVST